MNVLDSAGGIRNHRGARWFSSPARSLFSAVLGLLIASTAIVHALTGAIFTTTPTGLTVNGNIYDDCEDVYLNGGPQNQNASGLPPGTYYFQVTDPSGSVLLSSDPIAARQIIVNASGRIFGVPLVGGPYHLEGSLNPFNGSKPVQLWPFNATPNPGGEHKVWITPVASYVADWDTNPLAPNNTFGFVNNDSKTDNFKCRRHDDQEPLQSAIGGYKYYDANADGDYDAGELPIPGWRIVIDVTLPDQTQATVVTYTDANGLWSLVFPQGTTFLACEAHPIEDHWFQSGPVPATVTGLATAVFQPGDGFCWQGSVGGSDNFGLSFFNFCIGAGGGHTLGYWSNKNGQATMNDGGTLNPELALLVSKNLRNANGSHFDPANYAAFRTWILGATATNMAYMLSAQFAAMVLNVEAGFVNGAALLYDVENNEVVSVSDLLTEANGELGLHPMTTVTGLHKAYRPLQEDLKDLLDDANNNLNFIQSAPCPFSFPP
ncbi:hypothetical protein [Luteolibacter sp. LG18]|uniref:hypothetical protein n=1 Tax=Luteolibacter sp. LG18 TaxID=2819286 RepID=UPI002B2CF060|nr:hypothetical protein llg_27370 [Luteolibacter sp. LG18]